MVSIFAAVQFAQRHAGGKCVGSLRSRGFDTIIHNGIGSGNGPDTKCRYELHFPSRLARLARDTSALAIGAAHDAHFLQPSLGAAISRKQVNLLPNSARGMTQHKQRGSCATVEGQRMEGVTMTKPAANMQVVEPEGICGNMRTCRRDGTTRWAGGSRNERDDGEEK